ncbi:MAG TPA: ABC transporter ATP-binding protein [Rhodopirellula baltica]|uniref:Probable transport ATP-binding protein n=1 Tax=Rhodopirellula baltica (strain DSM 10527 / NCIMB 13988 / SH1) TaxID=243090 RepID=Q7UWQ7_RHOBA|nr:ABC transporter ATP-binding protein [Rhodopirellula baltica]CAD72305.1 probable transport ATP-binding protein [Rhodopirellula baltica SH 1]HBE66166.1 ABC transporter ATP-binding protein [Rhodopirellula baltica]
MNPVISTDQLTMRFRGCDALLGVDLNILPGTVFALLGENGAGKTTLIRILTGFQKPTSGSASVCDFDPLKQPLEVRRRVGYVSDNPALYDWMTVGQIGWFTASFYPDGFYEAYRESVAKYEIPEDRKIRVLSKGQRAKIALSLALAHDPELLILDEPTSGLDPMVRREFLESMIGRAASGRTVFLSSHQINEVERVADTIGILHNGKLQACEPLNDLKGSMTELTVSLDDPLVELPTLPEPAQTLLEENQGRQRRVLVRHFDPSMIPHIESAEGVTGVRERAMSLEEIFIAHTRKGFFRPADPPEGSHVSSRQSDDPEGGGSQSDSEVLSTGERS